MSDAAGRRNSKRHSARQRPSEHACEEVLRYLQAHPDVIPDSDYITGRVRYPGSTAPLLDRSYADSTGPVSVLELFHTPLIMCLGIEIVDFRNITVARLLKEAMPLASFGQILGKYATVHYPEQVEKCVMVNCPQVMAVITKLVLLPLPDHVRKRVQVHTNSQAKYCRQELGVSFAGLIKMWRRFEDWETRRLELIEQTGFQP